MHTLLLVLHVVLSIFLTGPLVAAANQVARSLRGGDTGALQILTRTVTIYGWGSLLVAAFGFGLIDDDGSDFSDGWLISSTVLFVVATVLVLGLLVPILRSAVATAVGGGETRPLAARVAAVGGLASLCYVVIAVLMVWQPN